ncbi:MAG: phenylacetate-CoA oxygenase/reductase subunit PaaK [Rhodospirillaceae bacterium]|nr:phenylacetate-CoA oxygenase/reductase subunit PaaK [Rhodospirillaceae bacterium]
MSGFYSLKITNIRRETADSVSICFDVPQEMAERFVFRPGQHLTVRQQINNEEVRRNYSVCVAPHENELRIAVKQVAGGVFSTWANTALQAGAVIDVMSPHGSFTWKFEAAKKRRYVCFAGGSGITPILSIIKSGLREEPNSSFTLFYGNRSTATIMFLEELAGLKNRYLDRLEVYHFLEDEFEDVELFNGRLDRAKADDVLKTLVTPADVDAFFICGPGPMMSAVEEALHANNVAKEKILIERFTTGALSTAQVEAAKALQKEAAGRKVQITLDGRRRQFTFDAEKGSILENARAAGAPAPFACKAGVCATCRAKVVSGEVKMNQNYGLSAEELAQGYVLTCQAVPMTDDVKLDYDA